MDSRKALDLRTRRSAIRPIARAAERFVPAAPSRGLHLTLAAAWLGFLYTLGLFAGSGSTEAVDPLSFGDALAWVFFLAILGGVMMVLSLAVSNHRATAAVSTVCALAIIVLAATCGLAGHPTSAWGPDAVLAAGIAAAGIAILGRRASVEA
ncbi:MAG: hypothetical protein ACR2P0_12160 [Acidimicrobiales bacterium]